MQTYRFVPHDEVYQWNQTNAMISIVSMMLSAFLVMYSINVNDGVVFFASICSVIVQSVVVCSPVAHSGPDCELAASGAERAPFMQPFPGPPTVLPLKPRSFL